MPWLLWVWSDHPCMPWTEGDADLVSVCRATTQHNAQMMTSMAMVKASGKIVHPAMMAVSTCFHAVVNFADDTYRCTCWMKVLTSVVALGPWRTWQLGGDCEGMSQKQHNMKSFSLLFWSLDLIPWEPYFLNWYINVMVPFQVASQQSH